MGEYNSYIPCLGCGEDIEQHTRAGSRSDPVLICPDGIHEFESDPCDACGEMRRGELAETSRGIIHAACMEEGEVIA